MEENKIKEKDSKIKSKFPFKLKMRSLNPFSKLKRKPSFLILILTLSKGTFKRTITSGSVYSTYYSEINIFARY